MSASEDNTRPLSVAELLARNGTIGSPPVGGRRRRKRRNSDGVSVAELTGEIPIIRTGEIPVVSDEITDDEGYDEAGEYEDSSEDAVYEDSDDDAADYDETPAEQSDTVYEDAVVLEVADEEVAVEQPLEQPLEQPVGQAPPLSGDPLPQRRNGPELSHDPRPLRRSSGAEQMTYDPVDESVNLDDLIEEHAEDVEQLRTYLRASQDTLFSGGTVADDLARRGVVTGSADHDDHGVYDENGDTEPPVAAAVSAPPRPLGTTLWNSLLAVLQSLLAVVAGAGLFIGFDQLWRWNNLVALILSVLVVLTLAAVVRVVRKTEDIVSTLTAVAVGLLVTLGPLALQTT